MTMTTPVEQIPTLARPEARERAREEVARMVALLRSLDDEDWTRRTDCPDWDVRDMAGHVLGMTRTFTGLRQLVRHMGGAQLTKGDQPSIDKLTGLQVRLNADLSRTALVDRLEELGPRNARWRSSRRLLRHLPITDVMPDGRTETWKAGYLFDVILTRDTWMHRVDISRAVGREMVLTADHDGRIVADVVAEWARRHGQPFTLELTGPAGGTFVAGDGGVPLTLDAVEFCRTLSQRKKGDGLLAQFVPF